MMPTPEECRRRGRDALDMAASAANPESKALALRLAGAWIQLAFELETHRAPVPRNDRSEIAPPNKLQAAG
jgi:hypothetical protein